MLNRSKIWGIINYQEQIPRFLVLPYSFTTNKLSAALARCSCSKVGAFNGEVSLSIGWTIFQSFAVFTDERKWCPFRLDSSLWCNHYGDRARFPYNLRHRWHMGSHESFHKMNCRCTLRNQSWSWNQDQRSLGLLLLVPPLKVAIFIKYHHGTVSISLWRQSISWLFA